MNAGHPQTESIEAAAAAWLARQDSARWTSEDELALQAWLAENTSHRVAWLRLRASWERADQLEALSGTLDKEPPITLRKSSWPWAQARQRWWGVALVSLVVVGLVGLWWAERAPTGEERYGTPVGGMAAVTLADGSRLTLNTRTRARTLVNEQERKVWLEEGEAFFDVQPDPARPFIVTAGGDLITVLGTKFSVRHEGGRTQVTVLEGRVRLDRADTPQLKAKATPTLIKNNDSVVSQAGGLLVMAKTPEQVQQDLSWRQGRLVFDRMALGEIAAEFNRYNRKQMIVEGEAAEVRMGGSFDSQNAEGFARLVHEAFGLTLSVEKDAIRLSSK